MNHKNNVSLTTCIAIQFGGWGGGGGGARPTDLKNASLWPLGPGNLVCAHGTTILTNRESSELVGDRIFYALQVRTRTIIL